MKKALNLIALLLLTLFLTSCFKREIVPIPVPDDYDAISEATPSDKIRVGLVSGVYSDMFVQAILPSLEEKGYTVEVINYGDSSSPNAALAQSEIDLNMYQSYKALNNYKFENNAALSAIAEVPTAQMGIFSPKYGSLREIENGANVSLPFESDEFAHALAVLEDAGLLSLDPSIDRSNATWSDIITNRYDLKFNPVRSQNLINSFNSSDLLVIDSSYAASGEIELPVPIYGEVGDDHLTVIVVRTADLYARFVSDIIDIVYSDEYRDIIAKEDGEFVNYQRPRSFYEQFEMSE